jgi:hypothetical protein
VDDVQRLSIESECIKLANLYCWYLDRPDSAGFASIYTEDAIYKPAIEPVPIVGRAAILAWIEAYPKDRLGRHISTNQIVEVIDEDNASGVSYAIVFREPEPQDDAISTRVIPRSVLEYVDSYRRTTEGWKISERYYRVLFWQAEQTVRPAQWADFPSEIGSLRVL